MKWTCRDIGELLVKITRGVATLILTSYSVNSLISVIVLYSLISSDIINQRGLTQCIIKTKKMHFYIRLTFTSSVIVVIPLTNCNNNPYPLAMSLLLKLTLLSASPAFA